MGGRERKEVRGRGRNFCSRWCRYQVANVYVYVCVCVCVYGRGQLTLPHFSQMGFSYNSAKQSSESPIENLLPIIPLSEVPKESLGQRS